MLYRATAFKNGYFLIYVNKNWIFNCAFGSKSNLPFFRKHLVKNKKKNKVFFS